MAVEVMIKRTVKPGHQARLLVPLILRLRALATCQPGYISGETLRNVEHPEECIVISKWETLEAWNKWQDTFERMQIQKKIEELVGEETEYSIYEPMVLWGEGRIC